MVLQEFALFVAFLPIRHASGRESFVVYRMDYLEPFSESQVLHTAYTIILSALRVLNTNLLLVEVVQISSNRSNTERKKSIRLN